MPRSSTTRPAAPVRLRRRPLKTPLVVAAAAASSSAAVGLPRGGGPGTPHLRWGAGEREEEENGGEKGNAVGAPGRRSVRRLAAAVWRLRPAEEAPPPASRHAADRACLEVTTSLPPFEHPQISPPPILARILLQFAPIWDERVAALNPAPPPRVPPPFMPVAAGQQ
ncbi:Os08g0190500 [Oryza sativa Japonica Group]|uniref:Os08g0190500 protein n=1 Tax=Oryza sativa subsp. japonica TaxID=39947 RepID=A0A0P0XCR6_ORYSJ|nr:hypothetical protein EE612_042553 [Oryza sativa]BAT04165.1 Os08g0190500 [Oryza sativa Japonica Group]